MGALYCEERDAEKVERRSRPWAMGMAGYLDKILDLTYPSTSYFTGKVHGVKITVFLLPILTVAWVVT